VKLAHSYICVPKVGESVNGDAVVVRNDASMTMLAVVDALGHGPGAAIAADAAVKELLVSPLSTGVLSVLERLHEKLHGTRGAAAMVCLFDGQKLQGCSVGNVEMRSRGTRVPVMLTPGILGSRVRSYRVFESPLTHADRLVIFSDGISSHLSLDETHRLSPGEACQLIMDRYRRSHDDATVLVADVEA
jgi:negative regulator of sigma-B (phosphoserine phosphatase)